MDVSLPPRDFPQDIIIRIVGHLAQDAESLMNCALVGAAWVAPCRAILFRNVTLGPRQFGQDKAVTLAVLDAAPSLASPIASLTISAGKPRNKREYPLRLEINPEFLVALLGRMPALQTVILERCAITPAEDDSSTARPRWSLPRLRLVRITPSHQVAHVIDTFHIMMFFRHVPVDRLELTREYDAAGRDPWTNAEQREKDFDAWRRAQYVTAGQYDRLRGWRVGIFAPTDDMWRLATLEPGEPIRTAALGVLYAGIADTLQLSCWGITFFNLIQRAPAVREKVKIDHLRLEVVAVPQREVNIRQIGWQVYRQCADVQGVTFVFKMQSLVERFGDVLYGDAIPSLPNTLHIIGFDVQLDSPSNASLQLFTLWDKRMQWDRIDEAVRQFNDLRTLQFGLTLPAGVASPIADKMRAELKAIVAKRLPDMMEGGKVQFVETWAP